MLVARENTKQRCGFTFGDDFLQYVKVGFMRQPYSTTSVHFEASLAVQTFSASIDSWWFAPFLSHISIINNICYFTESLAINSVVLEMHLESLVQRGFEICEGINSAFYAALHSLPP